MRGSGLRSPSTADSITTSKSSASQPRSRVPSPCQLLVSAEVRRPRARIARTAASMRGRGCAACAIRSIIVRAHSGCPAAAHSASKAG